MIVVEAMGIMVVKVDMLLMALDILKIMVLQQLTNTHIKLEMKNVQCKAENTNLILLEIFQTLAINYRMGYKYNQFQ